MSSILGWFTDSSRISYGAITSKQKAYFKLSIKATYPSLYKYISEIDPISQGSLIMDVSYLDGEGNYVLKDRNDRIKDLFSRRQRMFDNENPVEENLIDESTKARCGAETAIIEDKLNQSSVSEFFKFIRVYTDTSRCVYQNNDQISMKLLKKIEAEYNDPSKRGEFKRNLDMAVQFGILTEQNKNEALKISSPFNAKQQKEFDTLIQDLRNKSLEKKACLEEMKAFPGIYYQMVKIKDGKLVLKDRHERAELFSQCTTEEELDFLVNFEVRDLIESFDRESVSIPTIFNELNKYFSQLEDKIEDSGRFDSVRASFVKLGGKYISSIVQGKIEKGMQMSERNLTPELVRLLMRGKQSGFISDDTVTKLREKYKCESKNLTIDEIVGKYKNAECDIGLAKVINEISESLGEFVYSVEYSDFDTIMLNVNHKNNDIRTQYRASLKPVIERILPKLAIAIENCKDSNKKIEFRNKLVKALSTNIRTEVVNRTALEIELIDAVDQGKCTEEEAQEAWKNAFHFDVKDRKVVVDALLKGVNMSEKSNLKRGFKEVTWSEVKEYLTDEWINVSLHPSPFIVQ